MEELMETRNLDVITAEILTIKTNAQRMMLEASIQIGRRLCEAKEQVAFGEWGGYLAEKVDFSQSTANNLMRIYKEYGDDQLAFGKDAKSQTFGNLSYSQALQLLSLPEEAREEVVAENNMQEVSIADLKEIIAEKERQLEASRKETHEAATNWEREKAAAEKATAALDKAKTKADRAAEKADKLQTENETLRTQLENAKEPDPEQLRLIREEAETMAQAEAEQAIEEAKERASMAEKRLLAASMAETVEFKVHFAAMQQEAGAMIELIRAIAGKDRELAVKYKAAMEKYSDSFRMMIEGVQF